MSAQSLQRGGRSRADGWFITGCVAVGGFLALEAATRKPGIASSFEVSSDDRGTTRGIVTTWVSAATLPLALRRVTVRQLPRMAGPVGLVLQMGGLALRTWSMKVLGDSYTRTLRIQDDQCIVERGPYRLVRHPGYTGSLLNWVGFAVTSRSLPAVTLVSVLTLRAYRARITAEEELLIRSLPGYTEYRDRTKKLVPFLW